MILIKYYEAPCSKSCTSLLETIISTILQKREQDSLAHTTSWTEGKEYKENQIAKRAMISSILPSKHLQEELYSYIQDLKETPNIREVALIDSRACFNVISYNFFCTLDGMKLTPIDKKVKEFHWTDNHFCWKSLFKNQSWRPKLFEQLLCYASQRHHSFDHLRYPVSKEI